jgi:hypothetical protein
MTGFGRRGFDAEDLTPGIWLRGFDSGGALRQSGAMQKNPALPAVLVLAALLGGCASPLEQVAERARTEMVGMSDAQLKACAGEPTATNREGAADIWSYFRETSRSATAISDVGYTPTRRGETSYDYYRYCEAVFLLQGGRVRSVEFRGRTATGREIMEPCGAIVERCIAAKP